MKYLLLLTSFCLCCTLAAAQGETIMVSNKWCANKDSMLLFTEANNIIEVYGPGLKPGDITLKSLDKTLRIGTPEKKGDTLSVMAMPHPLTGKKMRLAIMDKRTSKIIKTVNFYCDNVPAPVACIGNLKNNEAYRKDILAQMSLKVIFPGSLYSYPYRVKGYTFNIHTDKSSATIPVAGFFLTKEILEQIKNAPVGTIVTFTDIKATCPECATRSLDPISLKIK
jgi:GldM C-terminal domain